MPKQTKPIPTNRVIAFIRSGKYLRMIELRELDWQSIFNGDGIGNGKQKKDVELAFYINADNDVIMRWEKPVARSGYVHIQPPTEGAVVGFPAIAKSLIEDLPYTENED